MPLDSEWSLRHNVAILTEVLGDGGEVFKVLNGGSGANCRQVELNAV